MPSTSAFAPGREAVIQAILESRTDSRRSQLIRLVEGGSDIGDYSLPSSMLLNRCVLPVGLLLEQQTNQVHPHPPTPLSQGGRVELALQAR